MKMVALEVPDDLEQLVEWWERQLVGLDLVDLVAQLRLEENESANGEIANPAEVAAVLESGLRALAPERLGRLAASPNQLLDWQDRVIDEGGIYWGSVVRCRNSYPPSAPGYATAAPSGDRNSTSGSLKFGRMSPSRLFAYGPTNWRKV